VYYRANREANLVTNKKTSDFTGYLFFIDLPGKWREGRELEMNEILLKEYGIP
jgi:hypothetical protein